MNEYISISFKAAAEEAAIISALLMDIGFEGMEEQENQMVGSIPAEQYDAREVANIFQRYKVPFTEGRLLQENWNANWEQSFEPVVVNDFAAIRAGFHAAIPGVKYDLVITPKMSFGTGHHPTTFMMVQEMSGLDFTGKSVIDFGTGTAVLAILAEKMGAADILAIDNDQWSISNSEENLAANGCTKTRLKLADEMLVERKVDIILANINRNVITANLPNFLLAAQKETDILISGFLTDDEEQMHELLLASGFRVIKHIYNKNWMAMLIKLI